MSNIYVRIVHYPIYQLLYAYIYIYIYIYILYIYIFLFIGLNPSFVGLSLAYTITLIGMFQYCVRLSAEVENLVRNCYLLT